MAGGIIACTILLVKPKTTKESQIKTQGVSVASATSVADGLD